jgi:hypothetical protein
LVEGQARCLAKLGAEHAFVPPRRINVASAVTGSSYRRCCLRPRIPFPSSTLYYITFLQKNQVPLSLWLFYKIIL